MLERICNDDTLYGDIGSYYGVSPAVIKEGVHRISNDGKLGTWRTCAGIPDIVPDHFFMLN